MTTNNSVNVTLSGQTGTGKFVGNVSPEISTSILDTNGNTMLSISPTASAVNYVNITNSVTTAGPLLAATGSDTNIALFLQGKGNGGVGVQGVTSGTFPAAGYVGEIISSQILFANAVSMTTTVARNITSISLTAGDWDIYGNVFAAYSASTGSSLVVGISTTSATFPDLSLVSGFTSTATALTNTGYTAPSVTLGIPSTTTVYLVASANALSGSITGCGLLYARRR